MKADIMKKINQIRKAVKIYNAYTFNRVASPITATIFTSHKCNLGCAMCWRKTDSGVERLKWKPVPMKRWESIIRELNDMNCKRLEFSGGGEPLLDKNFKHLAKLAKDLSMQCT